jgi:hypothetical protein
MAGNTNNGFRRGAVKDRSQTYNPKTEQYVKRDKITGRFISASDNKYKGITLEKSKEKEIIKK